MPCGRLTPKRGTGGGKTAQIGAWESIRREVILSIFVSMFFHPVFHHLFHPPKSAFRPMFAKGSCASRNGRYPFFRKTSASREKRSPDATLLTCGEVGRDSLNRLGAGRGRRRASGSSARSRGEDQTRRRTNDRPTTTDTRSRRSASRGYQGIPRRRRGGGAVNFFRAKPLDGRRDGLITHG